MPKEFEPGFGDEQPMPADTQERAPGVYVRDEEPHELDMLWSGNRTHHRDERSPLIPFIAGFLVGVALTVAVFMLLIMKPHVQTNGSEILAPMSDNANENASEGGGAVTKPGQASPSTETGAASGVPANATSYTVVSGDTLGRIAEKVYGSSAPKYQEKIQRANNMANPDSLKLDQKLVIPPKDY